MNAAKDAPPRVTGKLEGAERMPRRLGCCQLHLEGRMRRFAQYGHIVASDASLLNRCPSKA